jgi:5-(carboxyamino)imidazole ribonucleotide synthase
MINLMGDMWRDGEPDWPLLLASPHTRLHLYGKREARRGRKMGHYTCLAESSEAALAQAQRIKALLLPREQKLASTG